MPLPHGLANFDDKGRNVCAQTATAETKRVYTHTQKSDESLAQVCAGVGYFNCMAQCLATGRI